MKRIREGIFDEEYRVVGVEPRCLTIQGVKSGQVLRIMTREEEEVNVEEYPLGKLITLSDPSVGPAN